jgi:hypothetical protein
MSQRVIVPVGQHHRHCGRAISDDFGEALIRGGPQCVRCGTVNPSEIDTTVRIYENGRDVTP